LALFYAASTKSQIIGGMMSEIWKFPTSFYESMLNSRGLAMQNYESNARPIFDMKNVMESKESTARRYAEEVRSRRPEMQIKRVT
jgi:tRNA isopentenyl-2-thiomethyl-A-37 hydroxylase MiaE